MFELQEIGKENEKLQAVVEEDEKLLEAFLSKDAGLQLTLADLIVARIKENDSNITSSNVTSGIKWPACFLDEFLVFSLMYFLFVYPLIIMI